MKAMLLKQISEIQDAGSPLQMVDLPKPQPEKNEVLLRISVCGVCHTELDEIEGRISPMKLPVIPGHQAVGIVEKLGAEISNLNIGDRVGVAWVFSACGKCKYCKAGRENLCDDFLATGKDVNGGYAEYMTVPEKYAYPIPDSISDIEAAPLLCAGAIGYRSIRLSKLKNGDNLGLSGFGASAHLVLKLVKHQFPNTKIFVFARKEKEREFAMKLGAYWSGDMNELSPEKLDCIIDTTPVWAPVLGSLINLKKGGRLVINAIRKEDVDKHQLQQLSYKEHLWMEKEIKTVANVTSQDVKEFLKLAAEAGIRPKVETYSLEQANKALIDLKFKHNRGAKVLQISNTNT